MMSNALITKPHVDQARMNLNEAKESLNEWWYRDSKELDYRDADNHRALEALYQAIAALTNAIERLAELPQCDGGHE